MSLYHLETLPHYSYGIWKIEEDEASLIRLSGCVPPSTVSNSARRTEYLAVRVLAKVMGIDPETISYEPSGKPFLVNRNQTISISHTKHYAAVMLSHLPQVGIDIEARTQKVMRIRHKYMHPEEEQRLKDSGIDEITGLLLHWCIKEAIFKAIPDEGVDFAQEIHVTDLYRQNKAVAATGMISSTSFTGLNRRNKPAHVAEEAWHIQAKALRSQTTFQVSYRLDPDFILTCCFNLPDGYQP